MFVIVLESLLVVNADMAKEWKLKPGKKICRSCEKAINNVTKIAPTDDCDIDHTVGKNTEGDCHTHAREASKELFQDQMKLFGLLPLKSASSRDKLQYRKK